MHKRICHALGRINVHRHMKNLVGRIISLTGKRINEGKKIKVKTLKTWPHQVMIFLVLLSFTK